MPFDKELARIRLDQPLGSHTKIVKGGGTDFQGCRMYVEHFKGESGAKGVEDGAVGTPRVGGGHRSKSDEQGGQTAATRLEYMHAWLAQSRAKPHAAKVGGGGGGRGGGEMCVAAAAASSSSVAASRSSAALGQWAAGGHQCGSSTEATRSPHAFRPPSK